MHSKFSLRKKNSKKAEAFPELTNLEAVISPATEFHDAGLLIKRKILDIYLT